MMILPQNWSKIADANQFPYHRSFLTFCRFLIQQSRGGRPADKRDNILLRIVCVNPLKSFRLPVNLPKRILLLIEAVEVADQVLHSFVRRFFEQMPVEAFGFVPLAPLPEFPAHE